MGLVSIFDDNIVGALELNKGSNMSYSHEIVWYVIAFGYKVAVDIERHDSTLDVIELLDLVFTPLQHNTKIETFYSHWAKKESLIKALGKGLSHPVNTIETLTLLMRNNITLTNVGSDLKKVLYSYALGGVQSNYFWAIAINHQINEVVYLNAANQQDIFDMVRLECLN